MWSYLTIPPMHAACAIYRFLAARTVITLPGMQEHSRFSDQICDLPTKKQVCAVTSRGYSNGNCQIWPPRINQPSDLELQTVELHQVMSVENVIVAADRASQTRVMRSARGHLAAVKFYLHPIESLCLGKDGVLFEENTIERHTF
ncbi:unnamed protein product [Acanthocheilonema viteae]|uniref:Uncharacterized protein n=1 Tax=Acanthocheilonema viteae TaxID=6277 RepID=A0A498SAV1_ACAVI|nr:unnamed protein product [Acanthocheilonema viteae]